MERREIQSDILRIIYSLCEINFPATNSKSVATRSKKKTKSIY